VVKSDIANLTDKTMIRNDPKGTVLIIGAWNYPVNLLISPLIGAIAGGCTAVIKPSEVSSHVAKLVGELIPRYLDQDAYVVVQGAVEETTELLKHQWDHIFYTGNGAVGKVIMSAAAKHLTSVTLELGGKSPAIVSDNSDLDVLANRLLAGRLVNTGQTCVCIDYVLCTQATRDKLIPKLKQVLEEWYGSDIQKSPDYGRIVNARHWNRIMGYIKASKGKIVIGGDSADEKDLFIPPTVVVDCDESEPLLNEEIFGPILPIRTVKDMDEAIKFVNSKPIPLAFYVFSKSDKEVKYILDRTRSGGVCVNDSILHLGCSELPFGGFGPSGMGGYHNKYSFETFTHKRATLVKTQGLEFVNKMLRYPKFSDFKSNLLSTVLFKSGPSKIPKLPWKNIFIVILLAIIFRRYFQ
jgi:acyl-CoA reductase-like NAD-dependent aldehyde dehydrogenase